MNLFKKWQNNKYINVEEKNVLFLINKLNKHDFAYPINVSL